MNLRVLPSPQFLQLERQKQEKIIKASLEEFSRRGFKGASIDRITKKAGIAKGSIFNYFGDKHGLFAYIFEYSLEQVKTHIKKVRDQTVHKGIYERLMIFAEEGIRFVRKNSSIYRLYLRLHNEADSKLTTQMMALIREYSIRFFTELIDDAKKKSELPGSLDTKATAFILDSVFERFLQAYSTWHMGVPFGVYRTRDEAKAFIRSVIGLLREGLGGV